VKRRLRPRQHLRNDRTVRVIIAGHAFVQNMRRANYHLTAGLPIHLRLVVAFAELSHAL
jgi:hypothetical protein